MLHGIGVYHGDGDIDWSRASRSGLCTFAFIKASDGKQTKDPKYAANAKQARKCQVLVGAYHFLEPDSDGAVQADWLLKCIGGVDGLDGCLPPVVDCEKIGTLTKTAYSALVKTFSDRLMERCKVRPIIYANSDYAKNALAGTLNSHKLWIAHYTPSGPYDEPRTGVWGGWTFWQFTDKGVVPGVNDGKPATDRNVFNGSADELASLLLRGAAE